MRQPLFDAKAPKKTVSLTLNSDLYAKARAAGINVSKIAGEALEAELQRHMTELIAAEIKEDILAHDRYIAKHGNPADMLRDMLADRGDAA